MRVKAVDVDGYTPRMRVGIHTGRPQRIGSDWLGVDVNIAARVMERATRGELVVSAPDMERIPDEDFESLGVTANGFAGRSSRPSRVACPPTSPCID
jgi:adenylate cyclase